MRSTSKSRQPSLPFPSQKASRLNSPAKSDLHRARNLEAAALILAEERHAGGCVALIEWARRVVGKE